MKRVFNLIIVDESGSMSVIRQQAFAGMNETLSTPQRMDSLAPCSAICEMAASLGRPFCMEWT